MWKVIGGLIGAFVLAGIVYAVCVSLLSVDDQTSLYLAGAVAGLLILSQLPQGEARRPRAG
jgi:ethanolamine transporter EutH